MSDSDKNEAAKARILEEWKANVELQKWHDNLKQTRYQYFITIQTALLALEAAIAHTFFSETKLWLACLIATTILSAFAAYHAYVSHNLHERASEYIKHIKEYLKFLESQWEKLEPNSKLYTYKGQYIWLNKKKQEFKETKHNIYSAENEDINAESIKAYTAYKGEASVQIVIMRAWLASLFMTIILYALFLPLPCIEASDALSTIRIYLEHH